MATLVNVDNFARAESDRMFAALAADAGVNELRPPSSAGLDRRTSRSSARTATPCTATRSSTSPRGQILRSRTPGSRYLSVMIVNNDHYINDVLHDPGDHRLTVDRYDTDYVLVAVRILVDPNDPADLAAVNELQDQLTLTAESARPFVMPDYDQASFDATSDALLALSRGMSSFARAFGRTGRRRPGPASARLRGRLGRPARAGGVLRQRRPRVSGRRVQGHRARRASRRLLVDLGLQRRTGTSSPTTATPTA